MLRKYLHVATVKHMCVPPVEHNILLSLTPTTVLLCRICKFLTQIIAAVLTTLAVLF